MMTHLTVVSDEDPEDLGVCPVCGSENLSRTWIPNIFSSKGSDARRVTCDACGELWGGRYRSAVKGRKGK